MINPGATSTFCARIQFNSGKDIQGSKIFLV
jgi:hypothetical protein